MSQALSWIVIGVAALLVLTWIYGIRTHTLRGSPPTKMTVNTTMLWTACLVIVLTTKISPLHLLWLFPLSLIIGTFSLAFPFSLLSIPGWLFGRLCTIGIDPKEVERNTALQRRFSELVRSGMSPDEARAKVLAEQEPVPDV